jgi:hypothetical protein
MCEDDDDTAICWVYLEGEDAAGMMGLYDGGRHVQPGADLLPFGTCSH